MLRPTITEDVIQLAAVVREEDEREVRSLTGLSPLSALTTGFFHSKDCATGVTPSGDVCLIAGVVQNPAGGGAVWMLSSPEITSNVRSLVVLGRPWVKLMTLKYQSLSNVVDARNTVHRRLIKFMGFTFGEPIDNYGRDKITVVPFERKQNV